MGTQSGKSLTDSHNSDKQKEQTDKYTNCDWHPFYSNPANEQSNIREYFYKSLNIVNRIRSKCTELSSDYERILSTGEKQYQMYEIRLACKHHPMHHVESWGWVDMRKAEFWWPRPNELQLIEMFGWTVNLVDA